MRQVFLLLSLILASLCAYAQPATCTVSASPQSVRSQGRTELLPQIEVDCTGGPFTTNESFVPKFDITLTLSAPVTSQVLLGDFTEALLIFNDPDQMFQLPCADPAEGCDVMGTNDGNGIYDGITRPNIYQAEVTAPNQLTWHGVHLDGYADAHYVFRIRNVRTDVSGLTAGTMVTATLGITGSNAPAILPSPTIDVADVQPALQMEVLNVVQGGQGIDSFTIKFTEQWGSVLRRRTTAGFVDADTSPMPADQPVSSAFYLMSESGFYNSQLPETEGGLLSLAGLASQGSRVMVRLENIPADVQIDAPLTLNTTVGMSDVGVARLVVAPVSGDADFDPAMTTVLPRSGSTVYAVYEILSGEYEIPEVLEIPFTVTYLMPQLTPIEYIFGDAGLAPVSSNGEASSDVSHPRFAEPPALAIPDVPPAVTITTVALPAGTMGAMYSFAMTATDGYTPYDHWEATGLPNGLAIDAAGVISGIPTQSGSFNVSITVFDGMLLTDTNPYTLNISPPPLNITTSDLPGGTVGVAYNQTVTATGGTGGYSWGVVGLPPGLSMNGAGQITGTPTTAGPYNPTFTVTDAAMASDQQQIALNINPAPLTITTVTLPSGALGNAYDFTMAATGGSGGNLWEAAGLPMGLSISAAGQITGVPIEDGSFNVSITVTDDAMDSDTNPYTLVIGPGAPEITTAVLPNATKGSVYNFAMTASGGAGGNVWQATGLPAGLSISSGGVISGTPTVSGAFNPQFTVTDMAMLSDVESIQLIVDPGPPEITTLALPSGTKDTLYNDFAMAATGGTPGYSWQATGLPTGLSISGAGVISGTPTVEGSFNVNITVTDQAMLQDTNPYTLIVAAGAPEITTAVLPNATKGSIYNFAMAATGGTPGYSWQATGLPSGLSISNGGVISGTPTVSGTFNPQFTVTDLAMLSDVESLQLVIDPGAPSISTSSITPGTVGSGYNFAMTATGGTPPYTNWQATGLPPGLSINSSGAISGTPTQAGTFNVSFTVFDSAALTGNRSLQILIQPGAPTVSTAALPAGTLNTAYGFFLSATGGTPPYTNWEAAGLPPGLSISAAGQITGTPTQAGTFNVSATVTDSALQTGNKAFSLVIQPGPPRITTTSLPGGIAGTFYNFTLSATGGATPYIAWTASGLPPGLFIDSAGEIAGTPTQGGTFNLTVTVVDSAGLSDTDPFTIVIVQPLMFVTSALPRGVAGNSYSASIVATGGTAPYEFTIQGPAPAGLVLSSSGQLSGTTPSPGEFVFQVQVRDAVGALTIAVFELGVDTAAPAFQSSITSLVFESVTGGDLPPGKSLTLVPSDGQARSYSVSASTGQASSPAARTASAVPWLTIDPEQGDVPGRFTVAVNPDGLAAGSYAATLSISAPGDALRPPLVIPVQLTIAAQNPELEALPDALRFEAKVNAPRQQQASIAVRNRGGGGPVSFAASAASGATWIKSVTPASGQTQAGTSVQVLVTIDSAGLAAGQYRDTIRVSSSAGSQDVPVSLLVAEGGPRLDLSVRGVLFSIREGNGLGTTRQIRVINRGDPDSAVQWLGAIERGGEWLELVNIGGTALPGRPDTLTLRLRPEAVDLDPGPHYALVRVSDPQAQGSPQYLTVVLAVAPPTQPSLLDLERAGGVFVAVPGAAAAAQQKFTLGTSSITPVPFQATAATIDGEGWLNVFPPSGFVSSSQNAELTVSASAARLGPGIYRGEVVLARSGAVRSLNVTLIVADPIDAAALRPASVRSALCAPSSLAVTHTGMPNNFSVPAGWPATLVVSLNDNCGRTVSGGSVIASFTNGDPPLSLTDDGTGIYSATWQPGTAATQVNVNVRATAANLGQATAQVIGDVTQNNAPRIAPGGALHNISPQVGGALAPGLVVAIFGSGLATVTESTGQVPLAREYKGTSVLIGGFEAPLYFVSPGQLVAQLPVELRPNRPYSIVASVGPALTLPDTIDLVAVKPGIAAFPDGRLIAQHADFTLVDEQRPARRGETLVMYLIGLGVTDPPVVAGDPSPGASGLARPVVNVELTIDGQTVPVVFAGLTPGGVGLSQINFTVPQGARTGVPLEVRVRQGDTEANVATLTVVP